jgi:hypothetical protein
MPDAYAPAPTATQNQQQQQQQGCHDPAPAPTPPTKPDTPDDPCPKPKPCAEWPKPPCPPPKPDPCNDDDDDCDPPEDTPPVSTNDCCELPTSEDPATQLTALQEHLKVEQRQAEQLERVKTSIDDLTARITGLQKMVDGKPALSASFKEFYRTTEVVKSEILCFIPTVRCQLNLSESDHACIKKAIKSADDAIAKAKGDLDAQKARVERYHRRWQRASWKLGHAKTLFDFFSGGLKTQVQAKRDDLAKIKLLADPAKDRCVAEFYLREMEAMLRSCYTGTDKSECCFPPNDVSVGSFLDCWSIDCYLAAYSRAVVEFNDAEWAEKCRKTLLDAATKRVGDLEKSYTEMLTKRRETILASLKADGCCSKPC